MTPDPAHHRRGSLALGALALAALLGTAACTAGSGAGVAGLPAAEAVEHTPTVAPTVRLVGAVKGVVKWDAPLTVAVTNGSIATVTGSERGGDAVTGSVGANGSWVASRTLVPSTTYALTASVVDDDGDTVTLPLKVTTAAPTKTLVAALSPGDGKVVGIGQTAVVRLDRPVRSAADREAVEARLSIATSPSQPGAWRWMDDREIHYRSATYWKPGTKIRVKADLAKTRLSGGVWGEGTRTSSFTVGSALTSVVDVKAHTMTVSRDGKVLRVMKASMGKPGFDTRSGNFIVLEKFATKVMDGSTLATPQDYSTEVKHAVRITNSGTFTHGAPWSVGAQGKRNVSHGCINLSPSDAKWFYGEAKRGDVVKVINSATKANSFDAGSRDWNTSWAEWQKG
jgi:lipoprotein-anchoring transpeptidase ErfK/SrfK